MDCVYNYCGDVRLVLCHYWLNILKCMQSVNSLPG